MRDALDRSEPALSVPGRVLFLFLYPLLVGVVMMVSGFFAFLGLLYEDASFAVLFLLVMAVLIGGGSVLRAWGAHRRGVVVRPWEGAVVSAVALTAATVGACFQAVVGVAWSWSMPMVWCVGLSVVGEAACAWSAGRAWWWWSSLVAVLGVAAVGVGAVWWADVVG
ncbi:hypothetical protein ACFW3Z_07215 [Nocardiopsis alba]|uniref:hypothetical protein n=1 Tax=Nocardiopsis alba TaxID=53437 RepID=UPI00366E9F50